METDRSLVGRKCKTSLTGPKSPESGYRAGRDPSATSRVTAGDAETHEPLVFPVVLSQSLENNYEEILNQSMVCHSNQPPLLMEPAGPEFISCWVRLARLNALGLGIVLQRLDCPRPGGVWTLVNEKREN